MKVCMIPERAQGGVDRHIQGLMRHLPAHGVWFVRNREEADILHFHAAMPVQWSGKAKVVYTNHGIWSVNLNAVPNHARQDTITVLGNLEAADKVICPSRWQADEYRRILGIENITVIPNGIEPSEWEGLYWLPADREGLWAKNRVNEIFDPTDFFRLAEQRPQYQFASTLGALNVPTNVQSLGILDFGQMQYVIATSAVVVTTASREFFGIQTLEANLCGVPVLAKKGGGNSDLIAHEVSGFLYESFSEMLEGFDYLLANRGRMRSVCRETALCYQWEGIAKQTHQVYEEILS